MVDRYSTILASCLRDQSILIRRQTLMLLTNLIKEQYLIWGGPVRLNLIFKNLKFYHPKNLVFIIQKRILLFNYFFLQIIYRFVTTLLDSDPCIQQYANFCLVFLIIPFLCKFPLF